MNDKPKSIGDRIVLYRLQQRMSQAELAKALRLKQSTLSSWERNERYPSRKNIDKLVETLDVDRDWLLTGRFGGFEGDEAIGPTSFPANDKEDNDVVLVPEYNIRLSAGGGYVVDEETVLDTWRFSRRYLDELRVNPQDLVVAEVEGDSMSPTFETGDRVLINQKGR